MKVLYRPGATVQRHTKKNKELSTKVDGLIMVHERNRKPACSYACPTISLRGSFEEVQKPYERDQIIKQILLV